MRFLVAPDSFKGSLSALEASEAMVRGIARVFSDAETDIIPIADGGEGTVHALVSATGGTCKTALVHDPLGRPIEAVWGVLGDGKTAIIEMASASGLPLLQKKERDPYSTSTYGTGELIVAALNFLHKIEGASIVLGIGGSATNDGGAGAITALGAKFFDKKGNVLPLGGAALSKLDAVDISQLHPGLKKIPLRIACDVTNPLCGENGASHIFSPQKGASQDQCSILDAALLHYADVCEKATGKNIRNVHGAGAAGGLGAGLLFFTNAILLPGVELVIDITNLKERICNADIILTGEGCTDYQTAFGKAPVGVAKVAKEHGKPVLCISGSLGPKAEVVFAHGIDVLESASCSCCPTEESMKSAAKLLEVAVERTLRCFNAGMNYPK